MALTHEKTLATSVVDRIKEMLDEALVDEDYTRIVEAADSVLGDDEEAEELFALVDDGSGDVDDDDLDVGDEDLDDLDEDFDDEETDEEDDELDFDEDGDDEDE